MRGSWGMKGLGLLALSFWGLGFLVLGFFLLVKGLGFIGGNLSFNGAGEGLRSKNDNVLNSWRFEEEGVSKA